MRDWQSCVVAATGPSLTLEQALRCKGRRVIAVNDAWRLLPFADVLYACDREWWDIHASDVQRFAGERWSSIGRDFVDDDKEASGHAEKYGLALIEGAHGEGFCYEPGRIHYGHNSGFQAVNLAIQFGAKSIKLIGFDMHRPGGRAHFFGDHPPGLSNDSPYALFISEFERAAATLKPGIEIVNCTPGSALTCFPAGEL